MTKEESDFMVPDSVMPTRPPGEWDTEPDRFGFVSSGLPCLILRESFLGYLCGYVGVPKSHPLYGIDYNHVPDDMYEPHVGLTYSSLIKISNEDYWDFGFDCNHVGDSLPRYNNCTVFYRPTDRYRNFSYVKSEVEKLANSLSNTFDVQK